MKIEEFINSLKELNISYTDEMLNKLEEYYHFLIEYNSHTNLTAITSLEQIYLKHFYDSLTIVKAIDLNDIKTVLDIGTGAGFPGVVLKIFFPHIEITLLDSNHKKTKFLELLVNKLELNKVNIICNRSENYIKNNRESFDLVVSRAVADLTVLTELSLSFVKVGGLFISYKGDNKEEINSSLFAVKELGGKLIDVIYLTLPNENSKRSLVVVEKINRTSSLYPRTYDKILKKPLKIKEK